MLHAIWRCKLAHDPAPNKKTKIHVKETSALEAPKATAVIMLLVKNQVTTSPSVSLILSKLTASYVTCEHPPRTLGEGSSGPV